MSPQAFYIACGPVVGACNSNYSCKAKEGAVSARCLATLCGPQKGGVRVVIHAVCPTAFVKEADITEVVDNNGPVRSLSDFYRRCYRRWGLFTDEVNALLGVANTTDITDPQEAWGDILRFRHQEMLE